MQTGDACDPYLKIGVVAKREAFNCDAPAIVFGLIDAGKDLVLQHLNLEGYRNKKILFGFPFLIVVKTNCDPKWQKYRVQNATH